MRGEWNDDDFDVLCEAWVKIGTLYIRKSAFERGQASRSPYG
jgi:hypothetical protein